jgi:acyl carrier protein
MCTVLASREKEGEITLTAFVVPQPNTSLSGSAMRTYLSARIPSALVPSQYELLEQFPLTPNGKIDRQALRSLTPTESTKELYVAPRTENEERLTQIWEEVLGHEQIGVHDNFFDLGGHSLLATQIMSRVREAFAVTLPLRMLFEAPTVAGLAAALRQHEELSPTESLPPIRPLPLGAPFPLSFSQERMWFLYQFAPTSAAYNIPWAAHFHGPIILDALEQAVNEIRRRHAVLRTVFPGEDGYPVPHIHPFSPLSVPVKDFQDCPDETRDAEVQRFAIAEAQRPFDMAEGPLMRVTFLRMQAEQVLVLFTLHHIIADGWSAGIVRRELETLYEAFAAEQPSPFDELPIQYQDFAAWQRGWLQGQVLDTQLTYWTKRLAGAPMILDLPHDRPRGARQTFAGRRHVVELSRPLTVGLTQLTQREGVTLFMTLLASLSIQLGRYTASDDLLVGVPIANRHFLAIEGLIGTFVNTLVLRTKLEGNPSFLELLHQVRHTTLEAYAHQDLPFEVLVEALHPPRDLSRSPVFQVMLSVLNFQQVHATGKKELSPTVSVDRQAAQFDLTVAVTERPDQRHRVAWTYNSDLFEHPTIERMSAHFEHLLDEVVAQPHRRIHDLSLLPDHERQQVLVDWNATAQPRTLPDQCLPELLETQATQQPDSIAAVFDGQALTYGLLNQRANQLAHYLPCGAS